MHSLPRHCQDLPRDGFQLRSLSMVRVDGASPQKHAPGAIRKGPGSGPGPKVWTVLLHLILIHLVFCFERNQHKSTSMCRSDVLVFGVRSG